jgi:hypothetical protein
VAVFKSPVELLFEIRGACYSRILVSLYKFSTTYSGSRILTLPTYLLRDIRKQRTREYLLLEILVAQLEAGQLIVTISPKSHTNFVRYLATTKRRSISWVASSWRSHDRTLYFKLG